MAATYDPDEGNMALVPIEVTPPSVVEAQERANVDIQIKTAKAYPRSITKFREDVLGLATQSKEVAESCQYAIPRAGKVITGWSIRFAEMVAASYGNLAIASRITSVDDEWVTAQAAVHDLENNVRVLIEVRKRIVDRNGRRYSTDMIVTTLNAASATAIRNGIFKVVPVGLLKDLLPQIEAVSMGDERSQAETRKALLVYFAGMDVDEKRLCGLVDKEGVADLTADDISTLRGVATAIREGTTSAGEVFPEAKANGNGKPLTPGRHKVERQAPTAPVQVEPEAVTPERKETDTETRETSNAMEKAKPTDQGDDEPAARFISLAGKMELPGKQTMPAARAFARILGKKKAIYSNLQRAIDEHGIAQFSAAFEDEDIASAVSQFLQEIKFGREADEEPEEPEPEPQKAAPPAPAPAGDSTRSPAEAAGEAAVRKIALELDAWQVKYREQWEKACATLQITPTDLETGLTRAGLQGLHTTLSAMLEDQEVL